LNQFRTSFDKSRSVFTGISAGISDISENQISRYLPVFFPKREKKPWVGSGRRKLQYPRAASGRRPEKKSDAKQTKEDLHPRFFSSGSDGHVPEKAPIVQIEGAACAQQQ
jgi:hypothetical protein